MLTRKSVPLILSRLTALVGLFNLFANTLRPFRTPAQRIDSYFFVYVNSTAFATAVLTGFILLTLARGLKHKKRRAWNLALAILGLNLITEFFRYRQHPVQIVLATILITLLVIFRKEFYAKSDPTTKWRPILGFLLALITILIMGVLLFYFRHSNSIMGRPTIQDILTTVILGLVGVAGPLELTSERAADAVSFTLGTYGIFLFLFPLWLYLRRVKGPEKLNTEDLAEIQEILTTDQYSDSLSYFATRFDKSIIWSKNRKAGIAYRVENGVMLASGDPFGEFSLWPEAMDAFLDLASEYAWTPAVMGCTDRAGEVWVEKTGMTAIDLGDEAIIKIETFTTEGRPMKNVREMVNKVVRKGYETQTFLASELTPDLRAQLIIKAAEWRYGAPERGFSMALDRFLDTQDEKTVITIARCDGELMGFLHFVPWGRNKLSLDRMQRDRNCESGVNELLIVAAVTYATQNSITDISLNFAAFRSIFERAEKISAGPMLRATRNLLRLLSGWVQVESLYRFNAKFQPEWRARYLLYPHISDLAAVAIAGLRAEKFIGSSRSHALRK